MLTLERQGLIVTETENEFDFHTELETLLDTFTLKDSDNYPEFFVKYEELCLLANIEFTSKDCSVAFYGF